MYQPKYQIGQHVCSERYDIKDAVIIAVRIYVENNRIIYPNIEEWLDLTNGCDYTIIYNESGEFMVDGFSEQYLEEIKGE